MAEREGEGEGEAGRNAGGETRAAKWREGRKTKTREEISADVADAADATDSLVAEFPATKFGGHSLAFRRSIALF